MAADTSVDDVLGRAISGAVRRAFATVGHDRLAERAGTETESAYAVLGVEPDATWADINSAYRRLVRQWHPDGESILELDLREDLMRRLNAAYSELEVRRGVRNRGVWYEPASGEA